MNLKQLPYIIAIATTGSLSAASEQLGVSQPALSKYLQELEREVGLDLFFRNKKRYRPTPAGRVYIQAARRILELRRHTLSSIMPLTAAHTGELRFGLSPNRGMAILAEIYPDFDVRYPQFHLTLREGYSNQLKELLLRGELDAIFTMHQGPVPEGLQCIPIHSEELVLTAPASRFSFKQEGFTLEELPFADLHDFRDEVFVLPSAAAGLHALIQSAFEKANFKPIITTFCPNMLVVEAMIRRGNRVGLLPAYCIRPNEDVVFFRLKDPVKMDVHYFTEAGRSISEAERYLIYLMAKNELRTDASLIWGDTIRGILNEFDPPEDSNQRWEGFHEH